MHKWGDYKLRVTNMISSIINNINNTKSDQKVKVSVLNGYLADILQTDPLYFTSASTCKVRKKKSKNKTENIKLKILIQQPQHTPLISYKKL